MKVGELIRQLQEYPVETLVVMAEDSEGNGFSPLAEACDALYVPTSTWSGETHAGRKLTSELEAAGYGEEDCYDGDDALDVVMLWPTR